MKPQPLALDARCIHGLFRLDCAHCTRPRDPDLVRKLNRKRQAEGRHRNLRRKPR